LINFFDNVYRETKTIFKHAPQPPQKNLKSPWWLCKTSV